MAKQTINNSSVLVTGGAGFIGSNLIEVLLQQNNKIVCLDNFSTGKRDNIAEFLDHTNFRLIEGDIRDLDICKTAVKEVDIVLHQAALGSVLRSIEDPALTNSVNVDGFLKMLIASKEANVKRFVYAASSSTYGDHPNLPKIEERIGSPLSPYAVTKLVNELYAHVFYKTYGLETIGLRYFNVFGKRQDPNGAYAAVIPKFLQSLINDEAPIINGDGLTSRDFTYIDNVIQINQLAATTTNIAAINQVFNVAFGQITSLIELVDLLKASIKKYTFEVENIEPEFGPERMGDIRHSHASIEKSWKLLGYKPLVGIEEGLERTVDWFWRNKIEV